MAVYKAGKLVDGQELPVREPYASIDDDSGKFLVDFYEHAESRELDITPADVWADFREALGYDDIQPFDASFKTLKELIEGLGESGLTLGAKAMQQSCDRAVSAGRMERQWQMRPTAIGQRRMGVYRVVRGDD